MIDTHAHIDFEQYDQDRAQTLQRAYDAGVEKIINVGADLQGSMQSVVLATGNENIFAAVGLHPHCFGETEEIPNHKSQIPNKSQITNSKLQKDLEDLRSLVQNKKVVAIGEVGLDYFSFDGNLITQEQKDNQKKGFVAQIEMAKELNLPVIIHCRGSKENPTDAYADCYEILTNFTRGLPRDERSKFYAVFHCYGGNLDFTKKLLNLGNMNFSFTGNITYAKNSAEIIEVIKAIPMERIMLETDCPYLTPTPHRGRRNEPAYVVYVQEKIAEIKQISAKEVDKITTQNAMNFFEIL